MSGTALAVIENLEKASDMELEEMASALFASDFTLVSSDKARLSGLRCRFTGHKWPA
jgi:FdhE protein